MTKHGALVLGLSAALFAAACETPEAMPEDGAVTRDASIDGGSVRDASSIDAFVVDARGVDAGSVDDAGSLDASGLDDAATTDASTSDAALDDASSSGDDAGAPDAGAPDAGVPTSSSVDFPTFVAAPGEELTRCIVVELENLATFRAGIVETAMDPGAIELAVFVSSATTEQLVPFDCDPSSAAMLVDVPMVFARPADAPLTMPAGVAYTLAPHQMVRLRIHAYNPGLAALDVGARVTFESIPEASYAHEAGVLLAMSLDVSIPALQTATLGPVYVPLASTGDRNVFAVSGDLQAYGTDYRLESAASATGPFATMVEDSRWVAPGPLRTALSPAVALTTGGVRLTCTWTNDTSQPLRFGPAVTDERCGALLYYFDAQPAALCGHTDQSGGIDLCCPGSAACAAIFP